MKIFELLFALATLFSGFALCGEGDPLVYAIAFARHGARTPTNDVL